jgi:predicted transcriptional regulator
VNSWKTDTTSKRRDKLSIIAEILEIAREGTLKTQIMYRANLSFSQLSRSNGKEVYVATEKGLDFLQRHSDLTELLQEKENGKNGVKMPPQNLLRKK